MESFADDLARMQRVLLSPEHVAALRTVAQERTLPAGHILVAPGEPLTELVYILEGAIEVFDPRTGVAYLSAFLGPGQFTGEIAFLNGTASALALRTREESRVLVAPRDAVLKLMAKVPEMSDILISVFAARRRRQVEAGDGNMVLIGASDSRSVRDVEAFLSRNKIPFRSIALDDSEASALCDGSPCPGVVFGTDGLVSDPTPEKIARLLGLDQPAGSERSVDVLVVGGGPSGVAAAVYCGAEGLTSILVEELAVGGQAGTSSRVENYLGFPTGISGGDLVWRGEIQAMKFGTRFVRPRRVVALTRSNHGRFHATLSDGTEIEAGAVIIATGVQYRRPPWKGLERFEGAGVYYAATETEARYTSGEPVIVVGGGNSAGQAAMFLGRSAAHVHLMIRGGSLASSMSEYLTSRLEEHPVITLHFDTEILALEGASRLERVTHKSGEESRSMAAKGVFVMVGAAPNASWLRGLVQLDGMGFVLTGESANGRSQYETSVPGIFAVGDVRSGSVKRVASAVGEGSVAVSAVWTHIKAG